MQIADAEWASDIGDFGKEKSMQESRLEGGTIASQTDAVGSAPELEDGKGCSCLIPEQ